MDRERLRERENERRIEEDHRRRADRERGSRYDDVGFTSLDLPNYTKTGLLLVQRRDDRYDGRRR